MNSVHCRIFHESEMDLPLSEDQLNKIISLLQIYEGQTFRDLETVFVDEEHIQQLNRDYLNHDYVTDIITFPYNENDEEPEGTLFCCLPRIKSQASEYGSTYETELIRVVIHGLLHLLGYGDRTQQEKDEMRKREDKYINLYMDA